MGTRLLRLLLALGLVAASLASLSSVGLATEPDRLYLPWVVNGVEIEDPRGFETLGPFYATVTVHNPSNEQILVNFSATESGVLEPFLGHLLEPYESRTLTAHELGVPEGTGSGVVMQGETIVGQDPMPITAVLKQSSPVPQGTGATTSSDHVTTAGYSALVPGDVGDQVVLPIAQTNNNWNTLIRVTHFEDGPNDLVIHLNLHEAAGGGTLGPFVANVDAGGTATFDLLELGVPEEFIGSAVVTAEWGIAAAAERVKNETKMLIMNTSRRVPGPGSEQSAPLAFREWFNWNTGISVANLSDQENEIIVRFYDADGIEVETEVLTIPANGMDFIFMPSGSGAEPFVGSALIEAEHAFVGAVDKVKYLGDHDDTGHAMSYMVDPAYAEAGERLSMPLYQKGSTVTGGGDTSGIQLFNPTHLPVEYTYSIWDQDGDHLPFIFATATLSPKENVTVYAFELDFIPDDFTGSFVVHIESGGGMAGISNNVNYDAQYDGSASFNMIVIKEPWEPPQPPNGIIIAP